ncbi:MAG: hypothetical protein WCX73_00805 [Candidatus Pacearchaeota archaeon]|jgi:SAM-dependent methyltransferase
MKKAMATQRPKITVSNYLNNKIKDKLTDKKILEEYDIRKEIITTNESKDRDFIHPSWDRHLESYQALFRIISLHRSFQSSGKWKYTNLLDFLKDKYTQTRKPLEILDDGAGHGNFLAELKELLNNNKIPSKTAAVSLSDKLSPANSKKIDRKIIGDVTDLKLNKKYDLITSYFGSLNYLPLEIRNEIIKKYVLSLNKNGIAVFRFTEYNDGKYKQTLKFLSILKKVGFSVTIHTEENIDSMNFILLIERLK